MRRHPPPDQVLAIALAALAGFVDALGFLQLGGMFVSFMSGNSTRLAVGTTLGTAGGRMVGALLLAFVLGVMAGSAIGRRARRREAAVLALVSTLLVAAAAIATAGGRGVAGVLVMALAMGAANAVFERDGEVSVGVTYMTGTLVKIGQHLATAVSGGPRTGWAPYLLLWLGLVAGAGAGAHAFAAIGMAAAWIAAGYAALLLAGSMLRRRAADTTAGDAA